MFLDPVLDYTAETYNLGKWALKRQSVVIDNPIFFLYYKVTAIFLFAASLFVTTGLYIGDPIECISDSSVKDVIDSFCWVHSTFTIPREWNRSKFKDMEPHPGVVTELVNTSVKYHGYYQWISYILAIQALLFYVPRCIWVILENGKTKMLISNYVEGGQPGGSFYTYFVDNLGTNNSYYRKLLFCELLNFLFTLFQIYLTSVTNFSYSEFVHLLTISDPLQRDDFVAQIFPKVTKCTFNTYGPSGSIQNNDALCILPFNVINEKIYLWMWLWLLVLSTLSFIVLIYRMLLLIPRFRMTILKHSTRHTEINSFSTLRTKLGVGDWMVLRNLSKNMGLLEFTEIIKTLQQKLEENIPIQATDLA